MRATAQTAIAVIGIARISDHVARTKLNRPGLQSSSRPVGFHQSKGAGRHGDLPDTSCRAALAGTRVYWDPPASVSLRSMW